MEVQLRKKKQFAATLHPLFEKPEKWLRNRERTERNTGVSKEAQGETSDTSSLLYFNGLGGFTEDGKEYVLELKEGLYPPVPWINVMANSRFGFQISESGAGYTWSGNSRENKLTPWSNDPILDPVGEGIIIRDEETGTLWGPTPAPIREQMPYQVHYGQGYSRFRHVSHGIELDYLLYVPIDHPLKIARLTLRNTSVEKRRLSVSYYAEWVLGVTRELTAPYIVTEFDESSETLLARNSYQEEFAGKVTFLSGFGGILGSYTGDREEWIGRNGDLGDPQGLRRETLSKRCGAGLDPCGVLQRVVELEPGQSKDIVFLLGEGETREEALQLAQRFQNEEQVDVAFREVLRFWDNLLGKIKIHTPEKSMDLLMNRWLIYQSLACRIWARSAFYQSGGAYGFRDQLQDVMSFAILSPEYTREQILRHCAHQFEEGDVQHWWHAEANKGIRTKFSDDLLWLPFVTADYLEHTEDYAILEERVPYLMDQLLGKDEDERYSIPQVSKEQGTVYDHCIRALERGLKFGERGLPLIGSGDWNDGFSRIGIEGKGESVWLGWFIITTLNRFAHICDRRRDPSRAEHYRQIAQELNENMEKAGWDGGWYRRAYFDDGTPLGSSRNSECQIDAIAQSWSVISGGARAGRAKDAMKALENYLWKREEGLLLLLTPAFERSQPDPGYIQGYVPGVRENGGQYTHGAIWSILAFSKLGEGNKAVELFNMLNPINHARTPQEVARYKVEPYVMAADVYAIHPHTGRGGWTWYTGAAGWMYQAGLEGILGFTLHGDELTLNPSIPPDWPRYEIEYLHKSSLYRIQVENQQGPMQDSGKVFFDEKEYPGFPIKLLDDGQEHRVRVIL
jgi:cellobiose phosphorylase